MFGSKANGLKKRRAPLPEEIYPDLAERKTNLVVTRRYISSEGLPSARYSWSPESRIVKLPKQRSLDDIDFQSDNEALDVQRLSKNVKPLENTEYYNGQHKRHSCCDLSKIRETSSKSSLRSSGIFQRSFSLSSLSSSYGTDIDSKMVDQEDILNLTAHVRHFSDALSKLRNVFPSTGSDTDSDENVDGGNAVEMKAHERLAHECLAEVLSNLKEVINGYPSLNSNEILAAAGNLIGKVKKFDEVYSKNPDDFYRAIDQLALVFSSSISDLLMGDQEMSPNKAGDDVDEVDEFPYDDDYGSEGGLLSDHMSVASRQEACYDIVSDKDANLDKVLLKMESGVEFCLQWTKYWSKYVKDIANYIEKRAQLESEYTKQLTRLAQATRASISEENYLPFQSTFITALDQDMEYAQKCQQTLTAISGPRFMEPLMQRRSVHDRARKDMKDEWTKTCRLLNDSTNSVRTSRNNYHKREQDLEKLNTRQADMKENKEDSFSVFSSNKAKKEEELRSKVEEAKQLYINAIAVANEMQSEAEKTKARIVAQTKQLVNECDRTFRSVTQKYFDMMHELAVPIPIHFKTLADGCQGYEPGKEFEEFVRFQQSTARCAVPQIFEFQHHGNVRANSELESPVKGAALSAMKPWPLSDYEGGASPAGSPSSSPKNRKKAFRTRPHPPPSTDDESEGETKRPSKIKNIGKRPKISKGTKEAATHTFHKIRAPAKCSECDSYVFSGVECAHCGLSCHNKKCLENLQKACTHSRRLPSPLKRMKTFGVRFSEDGGVPVLVTKCVKEINRRGLRVKGIYRVSGVKSKMESLCQEFETNAESVDLSTQPPHLIASVLKLYIRQLPEPLMTTKLYSDLIQLAKESTHLVSLSVDEYAGEIKNEFKNFLEKLQFTIKKLPRSNYLTTATLIKHLHKVSIYEEYNQMNPQNLAIVFGPTILRLEGDNSTTSLSSLADMSYQTRIVALLIVNPQVFDDVPDEPMEERQNASNEENDSSLPNTPVEKFVRLRSEEDEGGMPDIYAERSTRVRGQGLSPMDQIVSPSSDGKDINRSDADAMRINERVDVKGEATSVFDEPSLPGSLERRNKYLELAEDYERLPMVDQDTDGETQPLEDSALNGEIKDEFDKKVQSEVPENTINDPAEDFPSPGESTADENSSIPRRRSEAFSVGKRSNHPNMLAKRGSALMNVYMGDNNTKNEENSEPQSTMLMNNTDVSTSTVKEESNVGDNDQAVSATSSVSSTHTDSDITPVNTEFEDQDHHKRSGTLELTSSSVSRSGDESIIRATNRDTPSRQRSATYESDTRRRRFENRQERHEKQLTNDRLLVYARDSTVSRTRRARVSVKDQIKQLENREHDSSKAGPLGVRNNKPGTVSTPLDKMGSKVGNDAQGISADGTQVNENIDNINGKENINGNLKSNSDAQVKCHEPLTRLYVAGENSGIFQPPRSPVPRHKTRDDKFCALEMDITLDSSRTPSSESSDDQSYTTPAKESPLLPTWKGRGLTPRDSSQAPEFV